MTDENTEAHETCLPEITQLLPWQIQDQSLWSDCQYPVCGLPLRRVLGFGVIDPNKMLLETSAWPLETTPQAQKFLCTCRGFSELWESLSSGLPSHLRVGVLPTLWPPEAKATASLSLCQLPSGPSE